MYYFCNIYLSFFKCSSFFTKAKKCPLRRIIMNYEKNNFILKHCRNYYNEILSIYGKKKYYQ